MVHKPKHRVHSFRGLLDDGGQDEINLERSNVNLAYRIVKLSIMVNEPFAKDQQCILKVYREKQTSVNAVVDFTDTDLLGAALQAMDSNVGSGYYGMYQQDVIFDNILFSRNIYITYKDGSADESCNYYIEIEEVPVGAATLMQLKLGVARKLSLSESPPDA